jgi:hypothetical protein
MTMKRLAFISVRVFAALLVAGGGWIVDGARAAARA